MRLPAPDELDWLDAKERLRAGRFVAPLDRERFVRRRTFLRRRLAELTGHPPEALAYVTGPHGRPGLAPLDGAPDVRFSVSSAGPTVLLAFACDIDVGVDIE